MTYLYKYVLGISDEYIESFRFNLVCNEDKHEKFHNDLEKRVRDKIDLIGYQKIERDRSSFNCLSICEQMPYDTITYSFLVYMNNVIYDLLEKYNLEYVDYIFDSTLSKRLYFDYDTEDDMVLLYDYLMLKQKVNIEKADVYSTRKGYHMHVYLNESISIDDRIKIYRESKQDELKTNLLEIEYEELCRKYKNKNYISILFGYHDLLFTYKKTKKNGKEIISKEKYLYTMEE